MFTMIFTGTVRHRRAVLGGAVVLAAGLLAWQLLTAPASDIRHALPVPLFLLGLGSAGLAALPGSRARPTAFAVDPGAPAFRTLPHAGHVHSAVALVFLSAGEAAIGQLAVAQGPALGNPGWHLLTGLLTAFAALLTALCGVQLVAVWRGDVGVQLRPAGLVDRSPFGALTVPWEALAPGYPLPATPSAAFLVLAYARPDLVRRHGLVFGRRRIRTDNVDPLLLGYAIDHYVAYPQQRPEIGTRAGYDRLLGALPGPAAPARQF